MDDRFAHFFIFVLGFCCFPGVVIILLAAYQALSKMLRPVFKFLSAFYQFLNSYKAENNDEE